MRSSRPGWQGRLLRGATSRATPQSTTVRARPCWRASTLTAAPPARSPPSARSRRSERPRRRAQPGRGRLRRRPFAAAQLGCGALDLTQAQRKLPRRPSEPRVWSCGPACVAGLGELRVGDVGNQGRWAFMACSTFIRWSAARRCRPARSMAVARQVARRQRSGDGFRARAGGGLVAPQVANKGYWSSRYPIGRSTTPGLRWAARQPAGGFQLRLAWKWFTQPTHRQAMG